LWKFFASSCSIFLPRSWAQAAKDANSEIDRPPALPSRDRLRRLRLDKLLKQQVHKKKERFVTTRKKSDFDNFDNIVDKKLWEALRACRLNLAQKLHLPPYIIFHDTTLRDMVAKKPVRSEDLMRVSGVGEHKLKNYGEIFLEVIRSHAET
jgi:superfamily II DNA helicase RecQ